MILPANAEAVAVSGLHSQTRSSLVPERPGKLRGVVRRLFVPVAERLAHPDAAVAAGLVYPCSGADEVGEQATTNEHQ